MNYALSTTLVETRNFASLHCFLEMSNAIALTVRKIAAERSRLIRG
ncbi:hypothetical protein OGM63_16015 [Plectonema radiosum NIES-515]|uniref:Uncharacterized protein n=1 Tax=Plectonema radiosum NIES-515 TaxID=2986073 RepID=A0ABT3B0X1_9CYAN|nr:hypothetical protein [Plectonema radiosum]MCV3215001.1 hypothetical protein [Plectonema radiosum NIES-515]